MDKFEFARKFRLTQDDVAADVGKVHEGRKVEFAEKLEQSYQTTKQDAANFKKLLNLFEEAMTSPVSEFRRFLVQEQEAGNHYFNDLVNSLQAAYDALSARAAAAGRVQEVLEKVTYALKSNRTIDASDMEILDGYGDALVRDKEDHESNSYLLRNLNNVLSTSGQKLEGFHSTETGEGVSINGYDVMKTAEVIDLVSVARNKFPETFAVRSAAAARA